MTLVVFVCNFTEKTKRFKKLLKIMYSKEQLIEFANYCISNIASDKSQETIFDGWDNIKPIKSYFQEVTEGICELLTEKDKRYGSFIETPLGIFEGKCASGRDIDKKLSRIKNADELRLNDVADTIGYLILAMKEKNWSKQDILNLID